MRNQNRRRNPDMEAYRSWQSDRSDRGALQRYLLSMDRGREVMSEPEDVIDLESRISLDDPLRQVYERVRLSHPNNKKQFKKNRWESLVKLYAGQQIPPQSVLILIEIGLRSGLSINDVYKVIHENKLINDNIYDSVYEMISDDDYDVIQSCAEFLGNTGPVAASAVPALVYRLEINNNYNVLWTCANALGKIGPAAAAAVPALINRLEHDGYIDIRWICASVLGKIGPAAASAVPALIHRLESEDHYEVRSQCAWALGQIGPAAASAVPELAYQLENDEYYVRKACRTAIEKITGESPE